MALMAGVSRVCRLLLFVGLAVLSANAAAGQGIGLLDGSMGKKRIDKTIDKRKITLVYVHE
jgi:hypothetical protein